MIGRTNLFQEIHCPLYLIGKCNRPFCHYKHVARVSETKPTISYSTTESPETAGAYLGFFDANNEQNSTEIQQNFDEDEFCASLIEDAKDISDSSIRLNQNGASAASSTSVQTFKSMLDQKKTEIDQISTTLANNPSDVQELLRKLSSLNESIKTLQDQLVGQESAAQQYKNLNAQGQPSASIAVTYKPTPIQELEKRRRSQELQHKKPVIDRDKQPKAGETLKIEQINQVVSSNNKQRPQTYTSKETKKRQSQRSDDYSGWRPEVVEKSVRFLERVTEYAAPVEKSEDLNSLINDLLLPTKNESKLVDNIKIKDKDEKVKRKHGEKTSKIEPSTKRTKKEAPKLKEIDLFDPSTSRAHEEKSEGFSSFSEPKKRVSRISSEKEAVMASSKVDANENTSRGKGLMILSPHEQLKMRFERMQKEKAEILKRQAENQLVKDKAKPTTSSNLSTNDENRTVAGTAQKGEKRTQHHVLPDTPVSKRPVILFDSSAKVPSSIRQRYLNVMIDHCLKYCKSEQAAYDLAVEQENAVYKKSNSKAAYLNAAVNAVKRLRDDFDDERPKNATTTTLSHNDVLLGKVDKSALTLRRSAAAVIKSAGTIQGKEFYDRLRIYTLTDAQLSENGYPRHSNQCPSRADFHNGSLSKYVSDDETKRICCRCGKEFHIVFNSETNEYTYMGANDCVYHWGKAWKKRVAGAIESRYTCCQSDLATKGCCLAKYHVTDTMPSSFLEDFAKTKPAENPNHTVYSIDCEMVYTTLGCELARVTVVNEKCQVVYDKIVKPSQPLLDCNSRFSGLTEKQLMSSKFTLQSVRQELLRMIDDSTILVGHSLESDLKAMKIIHNNVVDTSIVFPHRMGLPYKRALKTLMLEFLEKIIQDEVDGHDSKEDACSCMQLMKWKVRNDNPTSKR